MNHAFFAGIDPGFSGALCMMGADGAVLGCWDMPTRDSGEKRGKELDLPALVQIVHRFRMLPDVRVGLEWPTNRPGEVPESARRFGVQLGQIEGVLYCRGTPARRIPPQLWKPRLGLPGKDTPDANKQCAAYWDRLYPAHTSLIRGPRGGILDGRMDALLICHWLRTQGEGKYQGFVEFAKGMKR